MSEVPFGDIARDRVKDDAQLFHMLTSASLIEITADFDTRNLVAFFGDDHETVDRLEKCWEPEELQHGAALKHYVQTAWPDFD